MKILRTVIPAVWLLACTTPAQEQRVPIGGAGTSAADTPPRRDSTAAPNTSLSTTRAPMPSASLSATAAPVPPLVSAAPPARMAATTSATGSAYFGCGVPIPAESLWDETTESQVLEAIGLAKQCAAKSGRRLLLEFVAPWCDDCREMARLDETPLVSETLRSRFERVRVNVGKWDRHEALRENYHVRALATYIVIDPKTSRVLAQTTLEPVTRKQGKKLTAEDWASWLKQR